MLVIFWIALQRRRRSGSRTGTGIGSKTGSASRTGNGICVDEICPPAKNGSPGPPKR
jgi:hypothetical protein